MAILIPIPWSAHQEQMANASLVAGTGLGYILKQYDAMPPEELAQALDLGLERLKTQQDFLGRDFEKAKRQGQALVNLNAASAFADAILTMK
jgi:UDP-N-acetylglucosamine:LPS N-acetylglucosamine transferase